MQIKLGEINMTETMEGTRNMKIEGYEHKLNKTNTKKILFYQNGNAITCIYTNGKYKGVGVAKCNPNEKFDYGKGLNLAELRARQDFYKKIAEYVARR